MEGVTTPMMGVDGNLDPSWTALHEVSIIDFLCHDRRPAFVLDLQNEFPLPFQPIPATLINPALSANKVLLDLVNGHGLDNSLADKSDRQIFVNWTQSLEEDAASEFRYAGFTWSCTTLAARWKIIVAEPFHNRCVCAVHEPKPTPTPEASSKPIVDTHQSISRTETDVAGRPSRPGSQTTSTSSKSLNASARARIFFAGESSKSDIDKTVKGAEASTVVKSNTGLATDKSETSTFGMWSDVRIAKRNADLLAKISAFEAVGISITNISGEIVFANDAWYKICGLSYGPMDATAWMSIFEEAEVPKIAEVWTRITVQQESAQFQTPLKWRWNPPASSAIDSGPLDFPSWISVWAYPDVSPDGETVGCCCLLTDVSHQKWTERVIEQQLADAVERARISEQLSKDLVATENRFRRISDSMPHGIFMCNLAGNMLYANDAYREIFPGSGDPIAPEPWWANVPEEELARGMGIWKKLKEEHVKVSFETSLLKFFIPPNGSTPTRERRYVTISAYPELDENSEVKHITGCVTDISHLKIAEQFQVARANDAEDSKRQLEQFIDMTSHEIRNPFSAIIHSAEEVLASLRSHPEGLTTAEITNLLETVETIIDCTNHSTRIVDDVLIVSKLNSGLLSIAPAPVRLVGAVKQALKMFDGESRAAGISQSFTIDKSFQELSIDWVCLDISRVLQILVNLTTNAIKFTRPERVRRMNTLLRASLEKPTSKSGSDEPQYLPAQTAPSANYLDSTTTDDEVVYISISVSDSGCGLSADEQKILFQRFSQAGNRTHVKYGGTGLGLFISRQLCEMQGGQIGLHSTPGVGSVFTFYVKALRASPPGTQESQFSPTGLRIGVQPTRGYVPKATTGAGLGNGNTTNSAFDQTILLVEDNLVNQKVVAKMLRRKGFTVLVANHGLEALDRIKDSALLSGALATAPQLSLILLDVEMPVMDGLTCMRRIRKMEALGELRCHVPVVGITANARKEQIDQAKDAGMDDVVTKPFRIDQLLEVLTKLCKQYPI